MTLDEAIEHCEEVARGCECEARQCDESDGYESHVKAESLNCAADHRQLADWLTELKELKIENKELKRYLREAIAGFHKLGKALNDEGDCDGDCENCALNNGGNCYKWRLESEVLVLIDRRTEND